MCTDPPSHVGPRRYGPAMHTRPRFTRRAVLALAVLSALAAGCSGSDEPAVAEAPAAHESSATSAPATPADQTTTPAAEDGADELRAAVVAYSDAFLTGDAETAYGLLSERCKTRIGEAGFTAIVEQAGEVYGSALPMESYDAEVSGDLARVTYTYSVSAIDQDQEPWIRESSEWHEDDC